MITLKILTAADAAACVGVATSVEWTSSASRFEGLIAVGDGIGAWEGPELVGTVFVNTFGVLTTIAMMMVSREHQRRGIGARLLERALIGTDDRVVMLFATPEGQPLYHAFGFETSGSCCRLDGRPGARPAAALAGVRAATSADLAAVYALDEEARGGPRPTLIDRYLSEGADCRVIEDAEGRLAGYGLARVGDGARVIGPLIARTDAQAVALATSLAGTGEDPLRLDLEPGERALTAWADEAGLTVRSVVPRMVRYGRRVPGRKGLVRALASRGHG